MEINELETKKKIKDHQINRIEKPFSQTQEKRESAQINKISNEREITTDTKKYEGL